MLQKRGIPCRRAQTKRIIQRKRNVLRKKYQMEPEDWFSGNHGANHHLDKAKVHCSCKLCSAKTKKDGWKHGDLQKMQTKDYEDVKTEDIFEK